MKDQITWPGEEPREQQDAVIEQGPAPVEKAARRKSPEEKEITIKLHPWKVIKILSFIFLFVGIFFLGRVSTDLDLAMATSLAVDGADEVVVPENETEVELEAEAETDEGIEDDVGPPVEAEEVVDAEELDEEAGSEIAEAEVAEEVQVAAEEKVVTSYNKKTKVDIKSVYKRWHDTWGKMTGFVVDVTNNEPGTIKIDRVVLIVEGYPELKKELNIAPALLSIKQGETINDELVIPNGFAYAKVNAGELSNVEIMLELWDKEDELILRHRQEMNLQG